MEYGIIKKDDIRKLLDAASKDYTVYAPAAGAEGPEFQVMSPETEVLLDYRNVELSPKGIFFPQTETLCDFDYDTIGNVPMPEGNILVWGSRPCDALALTYLDEIFSAENKGYEDPYYLNRRNGSVMITLACNEPPATCFCTSVEGSPAGTKGADVLATELNGELLLQGVSEGGKDFLVKHASILAEAEEGQIQAAAELAEKAEASMEKIEFDKKTLKKNMDDAFNDKIWERMTQNCIGCGACTYLCPTCYCFDIADEQRMYKGRRIRTWDSCQYPQFTKHASGHNPRTNKTQRLRQRFMHKFSYTVENNDEIFCVGCGRCIIHCPVNLDIREFVKNFAKK
jgi:sulfhydrogenase subunit beta (sulfur reductase)